MQVEGLWDSHARNWLRILTAERIEAAVRSKLASGETFAF